MLRVFLTPPFSLAWVVREWQAYSFFYLYIGVTTPIVFTFFGRTVGVWLDKFDEQKQSLDEVNTFLKEQSIMDELTGFYNRRHILTEIEKELERAKRYNHTLVGIMIDVDDFKKYNDKYGHLFGDTVLKEVAKIFDRCIRTIDVLGRYGGDEFIILLPEANLETGFIVANRIRETVAKQEFKVKKRGIHVTVSLGVHFFDNLTEVDKNIFIETIDRALFQAKEGGKNRAVSSDLASKKSPKDKR